MYTIVQFSLVVSLLYSLFHYSTGFVVPDYNDLLKAANRNFKEIIKEYEHEPLVVNKIEGVIPRYKYILHNATLHGFSECQITQLLHDKQREMWQKTLYCPKFDFDYDYYVNGTHFGIKFVDQRGHISIKTGRFTITIIGSYKAITKYNKVFFSIDNPITIAETYDKVIMVSNVVSDDKQSIADEHKAIFNGSGQNLGKEILENILEEMILKYFGSLKLYLRYHCRADLVQLEVNYR